MATEEMQATEIRKGGGVAVPASAAEPEAAFRLPLWTWLLLWMGAFVGVPVLAHSAIHGAVNGLQVALAVFLSINLLICVWEISLWHRIRDIQRWFAQAPGTGDRPRGNLYTTRVSLREFWSTRLWARTWLGYADFDDGYADPKSFGFTIDVGNGFSTAIPCVLFLFGMTVPVFPPVVLGIIGIVLFYQKFYGTCLYFFQYLYNRRYEGRPLVAVLGIVGGTNGVWLVFPLIGLWVSWHLIVDRSFDLLR